MIFKKKKKPSPFKPLVDALKLELGCEEKPYSFFYDLTYENGKGFGACALFEGKLYFRESGKEDTKIIDLKDIGEIRFVENWGCVSLESSNEDGDFELCRAEMHYAPIFRAAAKKLEAARKGENIKDPEINRCPKCGRPFSRGMTSCVKCIDKKRLFARLIPYM